MEKPKPQVEDELKSAKKLADEAIAGCHAHTERAKAAEAERDRLRKLWVDMQEKAKIRGGEAADNLFSAERRDDAFNIGFYRARRNLWEYIGGRAKAALAAKGDQ